MGTSSRIQKNNSKIVSAEEAVKNIPSDATITIGGLISILCPEKVMAALGDRFARTGEPKNLSVITPVRVGWDPNKSTGLEHVAQKGMLKRLISGSFNVKESPKLTDMIKNNEIEAYNFSMGTLFQLIRSIAGGHPGLLTTVGLHTYVDPRQDGGRLNDYTKEEIVRLLEIDGKEHLFYPSFPIDVAIIRGTTADENGNITLEEEPATLSGLEMAMAAKASGGYVIAQVKRVTENKTLHPRSVEIPGILVDAIVIDEEQTQSLLPDYEPSWTGEIKKPLNQLKKALPLDAKKVILRRAAQEVEKGSIINLGVGIPVDLPQLALEGGFFDDVTFSLEHGAIGGVPMGVEVFGAHTNPEAFVTSPQIFDYYQSGGLSTTLLGFAQIDGAGNVNVSKFNGIFRGSGGFIDITHKTPKIMFCGTLTSGGLKVSIENGEINIEREGRHKKFINSIEHMTFNAQEALKKGQEVLYVTERCVFRLENDGLVLIEYAPGIDVQKDILLNVECPVRVADNVKLMDPALFSHDENKKVMERV
ncbi:CoA-transferase [Domibacillus sp. DTU_2020_1001157_1_SI_ALB_TIR_016]|uniref:acyl CoA:acetate/3-ketoacid CoA transferase n=1 Tax=Domibacillus sp. DTU_2020_1001157_1_SI_ALB_TIR_016 TaxID=3077789 RepID=UPI0028E586C5|nr:CoA-transferase [Domibacillus sp. DTU_2020_1001157_1_SI_ALB_TIR_016]WNS79584.1 CoA-transferase [Domibacillus sp. DTU_2020_1001157_1_SI_ALB_TIR_016]